MKKTINFVLIFVLFLSCKEVKNSGLLDSEKINYENVSKDLRDNNCILESGITKKLFDNFVKNIKTKISINKVEKIILIFYIEQNEVTKLIQKCITISNDDVINEYNYENGNIFHHGKLKKINNLYEELSQAKTKNVIIPNKLLIIKIGSNISCELYKSLDIDKLKTIKMYN